MDCGGGQYQLIAGLRRLKACKRLGHEKIRATILSPMGADELLRMEHAENEQRKDFTIPEQLYYADKIKAVEQAKARERQALYAGGRSPAIPFKGGDTASELLMVARPEVEKSTSRDAIAKRAGFTSGKQYERAEKVAAARPDLLDKIDAGETTIYGAYKQVMQESKSSSIPSPGEASDKAAVATAKTHLDPIVRAGHDRLLKNPLYVQLYEKWKKVVADANTVATEMEFRSAGYEKCIRNYQDNVAALSRRCETLEQKIDAVRAKFGDIEELRD